jgi:hypothetical protein
MSKLQHTPGPWKIGTPPPNGEQTIGLDNGLMIAISTTGDNIDSKANAHLIAAAPEMLEALITTYKAFNTDGHEHDCGQPCEGCECFSSCPNITVKQAIEKATGMSIEEILK